MARRVFFSFHFENDCWRANQVRNSWRTHPDRDDAGFWDAADWEQVKRGGDEAIKRWILNQLDGTSVTAVLIGSETATRPYVQYEIEQSYVRGNGLLGIFIHNLKSNTGLTSPKGQDPFLRMGYRNVMTFDYVLGGGYQHISEWIEAAYNQRR